MIDLSRKIKRITIHICLVFAIVGFVNLLSAQDDTAFEEQLIDTFSNESAFDLLYLSDNPSKDASLIRTHKNEFYRTLKDIKKDFSKSKKSIYNLYDVIHDKYFVQYEESIRFYDIFQNGNYNCLTGTAMYAMALDYLEVPYKILEQPTHVYLVVFHASGNYVFEATRPATSAVLIDKKYVNWYKEILVKNKVASRYEVNQPGYVTQQIYDGTKISLKELIGDQYKNNAIYYSQSGDFTNALTQAEMAYKLKAGPDITSLILYTVALQLAQPNLPGAEMCDLIKTIVEYSSDSIQDIERIERVLNSSLFGLFKEKKDPVLLKSYMDCLIDGMVDTVMIKGIETKGSGYLTALYLDIDELEKATISFDQYYDPEIKATHNMADVLFFKTIGTLSYEDPETIYDTLLYFQDRYPSTLDNRDFIKLKSNILLYAASLNFDKDMRKKGESYLNHFIEEFDTSDESLYTGDMIGAAFGSYSAYYVRAFNHERASEILVHGLQYDPDNIHLLRKKGYLDDEED